MSTLKSSDAESHIPAQKDDVLRAFGDLDDGVVAAILNAAPFVRDLNEAALWLRGNGDLRARETMELSDAAITVVAIVKSLKEEEGAPAVGQGDAAR